MADRSTTTGLLAAWREAGKPGASTAQAPSKPATQVKPSGKKASVMGGATTAEMLAAWREAGKPPQSEKRKQLRKKIEQVREFDSETAETAERALDEIEEREEREGEGD